MPAVNEEILHVWNLGTTGKSGTMTATLLRTPDGSTMTSASETVTIAEQGATGYYSVTYTPVLTQLYLLQVSESTLFAEVYWEDDVSGTLEASADNAYCSEADVIAHVQIADYTGTTNPNENEVLGFMEGRAGALYARMAGILGTDTPGPASGDYSVQLDVTASDQERALGAVLRQANAAGAAADALQAAGAGESPGRSTRVSELEALYTAYVVDYVIPAAEALFQIKATRSATHVSTGEITEPSVTSRERSALSVDDTTRF